MFENAKLWDSCLILATTQKKSYNSLKFVFISLINIMQYGIFSIVVKVLIQSKSNKPSRLHDFKCSALRLISLFHLLIYEGEACNIFLGAFGYVFCVSSP